MTYYLPQSIILLSLILSTLTISTTAQSKPRSLILPLTKDRATNQILTRLEIGTPRVSRKFIVDIAGRQLWLDCYSGYSNSSSTYRLARCGSAACSVGKAECPGPCLLPPRPGCFNNTCVVVTLNPIRTTAGISPLSLDTVSLHSTSTSGARGGPRVSIPNFIFACEDEFQLDNLAAGVEGAVGLSSERIGLPSQISTAFGGSLRREFALCLPSDSNSDGVLFFGAAPYVIANRVDYSTRFKYTRLVKNYERTASPNVPGAEIPAYFVRITSILVSESPIPINSSLLEFRRTGIGGSAISTVDPYTILDSSIYRSLVRAFESSETMKKVKKAAAVAPFGNCYQKKDLSIGRMGLEVPKISLVFESREVKWDLFGENSMVDVNDDVACLGFVDGGSDTTSSIVLGAHQMQDNLVHFDLHSSRMGFTNSLLLEGVRCSLFHI
ncbi:unnamed protein product [Linum trigynum]|uniref:Peptidase A1 domain-containing protein n=1 Tax=Linum trigynum TaxID=586398 RepID=A0AAV2FF52_9ROSI